VIALLELEHDHITNMLDKIVTYMREMDSLNIEIKFWPTKGLVTLVKKLIISKYRMTIILGIPVQAKALLQKMLQICGQKATRICSRVNLRCKPIE
jgi:hypothetical protein